MNQSYFTSFAEVYNCGAYGAGSFDQGTLCNATIPVNPPSTTTSANTSQSGGLVNTGANFYVPLAAGIILIAIASTIIITSILKKRRHNTES